MNFSQMYGPGGFGMRQSYGMQPQGRQDGMYLAGGGGRAFAGGNPGFSEMGGGRAYPGGSGSFDEGAYSRGQPLPQWAGGTAPNGGLSRGGLGGGMWGQPMAGSMNRPQNGGLAAALRAYGSQYGGGMSMGSAGGSNPADAANLAAGRFVENPGAAPQGAPGMAPGNFGPAGQSGNSAGALNTALATGNQAGLQGAGSQQTNSDINAAGPGGMNYNAAGVMDAYRAAHGNRPDNPMGMAAWQRGDPAYVAKFGPYRG